jgi:hypothetical protein
MSEPEDASNDITDQNKTRGNAFFSQR